MFVVMETFEAPPSIRKLGELYVIDTERSEETMFFTSDVGRFTLSFKQFFYKRKPAAWVRFQTNSNVSARERRAALGIAQVVLDFPTRCQ